MPTTSIRVDRALQEQAKADAAAEDRVVEGAVDLTVRDSHLAITPTRAPRAEWREAAGHIAARDEDDSLWTAVFSEEEQA